MELDPSESVLQDDREIHTNFITDWSEYYVHLRCTINRVSSVPLYWDGRVFWVSSYWSLVKGVYLLQSSIVLSMCISMYLQRWKSGNSLCTTRNLFFYVSKKSSYNVICFYETETKWYFCFSKVYTGSL